MSYEEKDEKKSPLYRKLDKYVMLYAIFQWGWYIYELVVFSPPSARAFSWLDATGLSGFLYGFIVYLGICFWVAGTVVVVATLVVGMSSNE